MMTWEELKEIQQRLQESSMQIATTWPVLMVVADRIGDEADTAVHLMAPSMMVPGMIGTAACSAYGVMGEPLIDEESRKDPECASAFLAFLVTNMADVMQQRRGFDRRQLLSMTGMLLLRDSLNDEEEDDDGTADDDR